ncbi:MAG: FAD-dependent oxidoreductase [Caldilineaceae bacterium]
MLKNNRMADVLLAQTCCASIETLSCADLARRNADHAGLQEFHIREGYTVLLQHYNADLPHPAPDTPVELVRWSVDGVEVVAKGETLRAASCIITLPIGVLQSGAVRFEPPLPPVKAQAIAARMEPGTKLTSVVRRSIVD